MTMLGDSIDVAAATLARPLLLVIDKSGASLSKCAGKPALPLHPLDLVVLDALAHRAATVDDLAAVVEEAGQLSRDGGRSRVEALLAQLDDRDLVVASAPLSGTRLCAEPTTAAAVDTSSEWLLLTPVVLRLDHDGFTYLDHDGTPLVCLDAASFLVALAYRDGGRVEDLIARGLESAPGLPTDVLGTTYRLVSAGLLRSPTSDPTIEGRAVTSIRKALGQNRLHNESADRRLAEHRSDEQERERTTGITRTAVIPVDLQGIPLLSLGVVMAHAIARNDGALQERYQFLPDWMNRTIPALNADAAPALYLFSNYIWTTKANLAASADLKARNPRSITVHGGPDTPKYDQDVEQYFRLNAHVDITIRGEGEETFAELLEALDGAPLSGHIDTDALADVAGICFREGDRVIRTPDRDRITDLDTIASPYLTGLFDDVEEIGLGLAVIETNRGCPYGCTFCDWGSATASRIRKFDLDRVFDELEWCARHRVKAVYLGDANFGIFERDIEIARKVVELKATYGFPKMFETNYAKNTVKHLREIVDVLSEGGIITEGILSLQSMDPNTLSTIKRSNIKLDKYEALADEFRTERLPLVVDIMMGLPGATKASFRNDLQECIDREVRARVFPTQLLVNSPMNDPEYREEHKIETLAPISASWSANPLSASKAPYLVSTSTYTRADYEEMRQVRLLFLLCENFGVLRQVSRFVRHRTGRREVDFYIQLETDVLGDPDRWPTLAFTLQTVRDVLIAPGSWAMAIEELRDYLTDRLGISPDSEIDTVLAVQHALLPARERAFPLSLDLQHDYAAWYRDMLDAKHAGHHRDWPEVVPALSTYPPATFEVTDPQLICQRGMGSAMAFDIDSDWELGSPVARPMSKRQLEY